MNILAFDTCYDACSAAILSGGGRIAHRFEPMRTGHAERLIPMIAEVLAEAGLSARDLDRIAVTRGPGTFTGTRIGIAAARALVLATGAQGLGFSSLHAIAAAFAHARPASGLDDATVIVARPSRRETHDCQIFDSAATPFAGPLAATPRQIIDALDRAGRLRSGRIIVIGTGAIELCGGLRALGCEDARIADLEASEKCTEPDSRDLLKIAAGEADEAETPLTPLYLRPPDAKPSSTPPIPRALEGPA